MAKHMRSKSPLTLSSQAFRLGMVISETKDLTTVVEAPHFTATTSLVLPSIR